MEYDHRPCTSISSLTYSISGYKLSCTTFRLGQYQFLHSSKLETGGSGGDLNLLGWLSILAEFLFFVLRDFILFWTGAGIYPGKRASGTGNWWYIGLVPKAKLFGIASLSCSTTLENKSKPLDFLISSHCFFSLVLTSLHIRQIL